MESNKNKREKERKIIGVFLKNRREQMGRSQEDLAEFLKYGVRTIEAVETGKFDYDLSILLNICEALEIKPFFVPLEDEPGFENLIYNKN